MNSSQTSSRKRRHPRQRLLRLLRLARRHRALGRARRHGALRRTQVQETTIIIWQKIQNH